MALTGSNALNDDPFVEPAFLAGLEAAGYLQRLDTSEARITARYQHALTKMKFAAHSEEFLGRAGVRKVHRSTVQFFNEDPVADPFVHVLVGSLPPSRQELVTPRGCETSGWTPIECPDEADGTIHFTMSHPGFWPVTVVFDCNQDVAKEDRYAGTEESDEGYLSDERDTYPSRSTRGRAYSSSSYGGGYGAGRSSSRARSTSRGRRDSAGFYSAGMGGSQYDSSDYYGGGASRRSASRRRSMSAMSSSSSGSDSDGLSGRYASGSRRGSLSARQIDALADGTGRMSVSGSRGLHRSGSLSSMRSGRY